MSLLPTVCWTGIVYREVAAGDDAGSTARLRLVVLSAGESATQLIIPCSVKDPVLARVVLSELTSGCIVRVTGTLRIPNSDDGFWLDVTSVERLLTVPVPDFTSGQGLPQRGPCVAWEGYVTGEVHAGTGAAAHMGLIVSWTDDPVDELVMPVAISDPALAQDLTELQEGHHLRLTGHLCLSPSGDTLWLEATGTEVLDAPALCVIGDGPASLYWHHIHGTRDRSYVVADLGGSHLSVWSPSGYWVGYAFGPGEVDTKIAEYEQKLTRDS
ncbi:hypothetical protein ACFV3E_36580 [Streptomyces sp. NPDC059718]